MKAPEIAISPNKGRCVIAKESYNPHDMILINPVVLIEIDALNDSSTFNAYPMRWSDTHNSIALGLINLLNHSEEPNCEIICNFEDLFIACRAIKKIAAGEELTIKYACDLWFKPEN